MTDNFVGEAEAELKKLRIKTSGNINKDSFQEVKKILNPRSSDSQSQISTKRSKTPNKDTSNN